MTDRDDRYYFEVSRDASVGFYDIAIACVDVANDELQVALDKFHDHVWRFVTPDGGQTRTTVALDRAKALATWATYRYAKMVGTIAHLTGDDAAELIRQYGRGSAVLNALAAEGPTEDDDRCSSDP